MIPLDPSMSVYFLSSLFIPECIHIAQLESQISQTEEKPENGPICDLKAIYASVAK